MWVWAVQAGHGLDLLGCSGERPQALQERPVRRALGADRAGDLGVEGRPPVADGASGPLRMREIVNAICTRAGPAAIGLRGFPRGACLDASLLLAEYLEDCGLGTWGCVAGARPHSPATSKSHAKWRTLTGVPLAENGSKAGTTTIRPDAGNPAGLEKIREIVSRWRSIPEPRVRSVPPDSAGRERGRSAAKGRQGDVGAVCHGQPAGMPAPTVRPAPASAPSRRLAPQDQPAAARAPSAPPTSPLSPRRRRPGRGAGVVRQDHLHDGHARLRPRAHPRRRHLPGRPPVSDRRPAGSRWRSSYGVPVAPPRPTQAGPPR